MEYIKKDLGSYKLHMIKTTKFKTIRVKVSFRRPIVKEEITKRNVLSDILVQTSKNYKSRRDLAIKAQDLYAASISSGNTRIGNYINTDIILAVLNDKYTEEGNFASAVDFLHELIYEPNVENEVFDEEVLNIIKTRTKTSLESLKEDSNLYSLIRLLEVMTPDSPMSYRTVGYMDDLEGIDTKNLQFSYG